MIAMIAEFMRAIWAAVRSQPEAIQLNFLKTQNNCIVFPQASSGMLDIARLSCHICHVFTCCMFDFLGTLETIRNIRVNFVKLVLLWLN